MRVAILGTGKMGAAVARRLAAEGQEVVLWNRTPERATRLGLGSVAETPAAAAAGADLVLTVLTGPEADRATYEGPGGALQEAEGRLFVDLTTGGPDNAIALASATRAKGGRYLEAPVLGGPAAIESGKLVILAGGDAAAWTRRGRCCRCSARLAMWATPARPTSSSWCPTRCWRA